MATNWLDRVPTYPGRWKITKEDGSYEYVTMERADEPTVEGTPVNAANMNALEKGAAAGLAAMPKTGGDFTGAIKVVSPLKLAGANYPAIDFYKTSIANPIGGLSYDGANRRFYLASYAADMDSASKRYAAKYCLPVAATGLTADKSYDIITSAGGTFEGKVSAGSVTTNAWAMRNIIVYDKTDTTAQQTGGIRMVRK